MLMGVMSGSIYTLAHHDGFAQEITILDDTLGVFHTHAVAGFLGGILSGILAETNLLRMFYADPKYGPGLLCSIGEQNLSGGLRQMRYQIYVALFITVWNVVVVTSFICILVSRIVNLRMDEEDLLIGHNAMHGEDAYALWGDGERHHPPLGFLTLRMPAIFRRH